MIVVQLSQYTDFSSAQANDIVKASLANNQVSWIISDGDVHEFLGRIAKDCADGIEPKSLEKLQGELAASAPEADDDGRPPFFN